MKRLRIGSSFWLVGALSMSLILPGCSTIEEVREKPALLEFRTSASAKDVAECIRDGWQAISVLGGPLGGDMQSSGARYTVVAPNVEQPWHVVDVMPTAKGTQVSYHFKNTWQSPLERIVQVVRSCEHPAAP